MNDILNKIRTLSSGKKFLLATGIAIAFIGIAYISKPEWFEKELVEDLKQTA